MKRTTVFLDEAIERDLRRLAGRRGVPVAGLVREALARYVTAAESELPAAPRFVGAGASGRADVAERHEELLFDGAGAGTARSRAAARRKPPARAKR